MTAGVISGIDRSFSSPECEYECSGLVQTDTSINPGNSGGALLNLDGELVGVNLDALVKSPKSPFFVIPAKAGIQSFQLVTEVLDPVFQRGDDFLR
ncbi:MAG: trypsin-like peptidase domain-containing protein, partial [Pseudomonadota bacterium]